MGIGDVLVSNTIHNHDRRMLLPIFVDYGVHNHAAVPTPKLREVRRDFFCLSPPKGPLPTEAAAGRLDHPSIGLSLPGAFLFISGKTHTDVN